MTQPLKCFNVVLEIEDIYAATAEDAVRLAIRWLEKDGLRSWVYQVDQDRLPPLYVDAEGLDYSSNNEERILAYLHVDAGGSPNAE